MPLLFAEHALERFRERFNCQTMSDAPLIVWLRDQINKNEKSGRNTPGGRYIPISYLGEDGYAVVKRNTNTVITFMPKGWCKDILPVNLEL